MGKKQQQQRTKGNRQAFTSAKAASLLETSGASAASTVGFVGFDAFSSSAAADDSSAALATSEEVPSNVSGEYHVLLLKLFKNDAVTKAKALRSLLELANAETDSTKLTDLAACWPRLYARLALSSNFQVRQLSHRLTHLLCVKCGRGIERHLHGLLPYWLLGMHDPVHEVARQAHGTFQEAFADATKWSKAIELACAPVIGVCTDVLLQSAQFSTMALAQSKTPDETDAARLARLRVCALDNLNFVSAHATEQAEPELRRLCWSSAAFWRAADKLADVTIRGKLYRLLGTWTALFPDDLRPALPKFANAILANALFDADFMANRAAAAHVWDTAALLFKQYGAPALRPLVSLDKQLCPRLLKLAETGIDEQSHFVCAYLLPMTSYLDAGDGRFTGQMLQAIVAGVQQTYRQARQASPLRHNNNSNSGSPVEASQLQAAVDCLLLTAANQQLQAHAQTQLAQLMAHTLSDGSASSAVLLAQHLASPAAVKTLFADVSSAFSGVVREQLQRAARLAASNAKVGRFVQTLGIHYHIIDEHHSVLSALSARCVLSGCCAGCTPTQPCSDAHLPESLESLACALRLGDSLAESALAQPSQAECVAAHSLVSCALYASCVRQCPLAVRTVVRLARSMQFGQPTLAIVSECPYLPARVELLSVVLDANVDDTASLLVACVPPLQPRLTYTPLWTALRGYCARRITDDGSLAALDPLVNWPEVAAASPTELERLGPDGLLVLLLVALKSIAAAQQQQELVRRLFSAFAAQPHAAADAYSLLGRALSDGGGDSEFRVQLLSEHVLTIPDSPAEDWPAVRRLYALLLSTESGSTAQPFALDAFFHSYAVNQRWTTVFDQYNDIARDVCALDLASPCVLIDDPPEPADIPLSIGLARQQLAEVVDLLGRLSLVFDHVTVADAMLLADAAQNERHTSEAFTDLLRDTLLVPTALTALLLNAPELLKPAVNTDRSARLDVVASLAALCERATTLRQSLPDEQTSQLCRLLLRDACASDAMSWTLPHLLLLYAAQVGPQLSTQPRLVDGLPQRCALGMQEQCLQHVQGALAVKATADLHTWHEALLDAFVAPVSVAVRLAEAFIQHAHDVALEQGQLLSEPEQLVDDDVDLVDTNHYRLGLCASLVRLLWRVCGRQQLQLSEPLREYSCCNVVVWCQSGFTASHSLSALTDRQLLLLRHVLRLYACCQQRALLSGDDDIFGREWFEFFVPGCAGALVSCWLHWANETDATVDATATLQLGRVLHELSAVVRQVLRHTAHSAIADWPLATTALHHPYMDTRRYPSELQSLLSRTLTAFGSHPSLTVRACAQNILKWCLTEIVELEKPHWPQEGEQLTDDHKEMKCCPPQYLLDVHAECFGRVSQLLRGGDGDSPDLLLTSSAELPRLLFTLFHDWLLLLEFYALVPKERLAPFSAHLRDSGLLEQLLLVLFVVLPDNVNQLLDSTNSTPNTPGMARLRASVGQTTAEQPQPQQQVATVNDLFTQPDALGHAADLLETQSSSVVVQRLACQCYYAVLTRWPTLVRHWYNSIDRSMHDTVNRFTSAYVSPLICANQLAAFSEKSDFGDLKVVVRSAVREVDAMYETEDCTMKLHLQLPANYPLAQPKVDTDRVAASKAVQRKWLLQMTVCLAHQNGTLVDGLQLWKANIERHMSGAEDCSVCMSTVHSVSYQLPRVTCRQCKHKFHADCLYKWFNSSQNSSCPLCRNVF